MDMFVGPDATNSNLVQSASDSIVLLLNVGDVITLTTQPPVADDNRTTTSDIIFSGYLLSFCPPNSFRRPSVENQRSSCLAPKVVALSVADREG